MQAGMWGSLGKTIPNIQEEIFKYYKKLNFRLHKFSDQYFLGEVIYPLTLDESLSHDEFSNYPDKIKTNIKRDRIIDDYSIIGEVFNHEDIPMGDQRSPFRQ
jgi:hypothetical protein